MQDRFKNGSKFFGPTENVEVSTEKRYDECHAYSVEYDRPEDFRIQLWKYTTDAFILDKFSENSFVEISQM